MASSEAPTVPDTPNTTCARCGNHYTTEKSYLIHLHRKKPCVAPGEPQWRCSACDVNFESGDAKYSHCRSKKHKRAVEMEKARQEAAARGEPLPPVDLSGCEVCGIERFCTEEARTTHLKLKRHSNAVQQKEKNDRREARLAAGEDIPGCDVCKHESFLTQDARDSHLMTKTHLAAVKRLQERVEGCEACGIERFRSEAVRAAHLMAKTHLANVEKAERREQRKLGRRVRNRTRGARQGRGGRAAAPGREDYVAAGPHRVGRAPKPGVPSPESTSEAVQAPASTPAVAHTEATESASCPTREVAEAIIESEPGPSDRSMIVAETTSHLADPLTDGEGYSDERPEDDFMAFLLSRFSDEQRRMFAESYAVYAREDMRDSFCIDLDQAFKWMGYTRKDTAVAHVKKHLQPEEYRMSQVDPPVSTGTDRSFHTAIRYRLTPRAFKKVLLCARTEQGNMAIQYFLDIEQALLDFGRLRRTSGAVSQFDSSARARRNGLGLRSVTDSIDTHQPGVYFGVPERTWAMLKPLNPTFSPDLLAVNRSEMTVIKFGMKRGDTDRTGQHSSTFGGFYLLDHLPTENMAEVEDLLKLWLKNEGLLFEAVHGNSKNTRNTELIVVTTQADYRRVVERVQLLIQQTEDNKRRMLGVGELAREEEARAEQERGKARQEEAKAVQEAERRGQEAERRGQETERSKQMAEKTAQDQMAFQIRMAELDLEKMKMSVSMKT